MERDRSASEVSQRHETGEPHLDLDPEAARQRRLAALHALAEQALVNIPGAPSSQPPCDCSSFSCRRYGTRAGLLRILALRSFSQHPDF